MNTKRKDKNQIVHNEQTNTTKTKEAQNYTGRTNEIKTNKERKKNTKKDRNKERNRQTKKERK
jgi:hypothetical protein